MASQRSATAQGSGSIDALRALTTLVRHLNAEVRLDDFFRHIARAASHVTGCDSALVMWTGRQLGDAYVTGSYGLPVDYLEHFAGAAGTSAVWSPITEAHSFANPVLIEDIRSEDRLAFWHDIAERGGVRAMATFPLLVQDEPLGALSLYFRDPHGFVDAEVNAASAMADIAASAIQISLLRSERESQLLDLEHALEERTRLDRFHRLLTTASVSRMGTDALIAAATVSLGVTVLAEDLRGRTIAAAAPEGMTDRIAALAGWSRHTAQAPMPPSLSVMSRPLVVHGSARGTLHVLSSESAATSQHALEYLGLALEAEFAATIFDEHAREKLLETALEHLLSVRDGRDLDAVRAELSRLGFGLDFPLDLCVAAADENGGEARGMVAAAVRASLGAGTFHALHGPHLISLEAGGGASALGRLRSSLGSHREEWRTATFHGVKDAADLRRAVEIGTRLLSVAARLNAPARDIDGDQLGIAQILLEATSSATLTGFLDSIVAPLRAYDGSHGSELLHTLKTFVRCQLHHKETAAALFVHVNTLTYRITKIGQILHRDMRSLAALSELSIACHLDDVFAARVTPDE